VPGIVNIIPEIRAKKLSFKPGKDPQLAFFSLARSKKKPGKDTLREHDNHEGGLNRVSLRLFGS
jgi:hypothetical protein